MTEPNSHHYDFSLRLNDPVSTHAVQFQLVPENSNVLDVGCHSGILGEALKAQKRCHVFGIDSDSDALVAASKRLDGVQQVDLEAAGWADSVSVFGRFDIVLFGDVLEHTRDPLAILRESRRVLSNGGAVIVSVPNVANLRVRLGLLRGRFDYVDAGILDRGHLRFFTRASARKMVTDAGFEIEREAFSGYSLPKWLINFFPTLFAVNIILVGRATDDRSSA